MICFSHLLYKDAGIKFYFDQSGTSTFSYESIDNPGQFITMNSTTGLFYLASTSSGNVYKFHQIRSDTFFLLRAPGTTCYLVFDEKTGDQLPNPCAPSNDLNAGRMRQIV